MALYWQLASSEDKFPRGIKFLADYAHTNSPLTKGMKLGIYSATLGFSHHG